jgi:hypothetical protein
VSVEINTLSKYVSFGLFFHRVTTTGKGLFEQPLQQLSILVTGIPLPPSIHEGTEEGVEACAMGALRSICALSNSGHHMDRAGIEQIIDMDRYKHFISWLQLFGYLQGATCTWNTALQASETLAV